MWDLIMHGWGRLIIALIIGLATAWWIWGRGAASQSDEDGADERDAPPFAPDPKPEPELEPVPEPERESAAPVAAPLAAAAAAGSISAENDDESEASKPKIAAAVGDADDLTRIKGIGPKLNDLCHSLGVLRFDQIAAWSAADVAEVDQYLKIKGRIDRDSWVDQAKLLAAGDDAAHEAQFG